MYLVKTPWLLKKIYPTLIWDKNITNTNAIYLTFDDGPHPIATPFVLDVLKEYNAKATFFCIGKNVEQYPEIYEKIIAEGHSTGNHTHNHFNGFKTDDNDYIKNVKQATEHISSSLFRPPYGRITRFQAKLIQQLGFKIIMWDVLSGDFDIKLSKEKCLANVLLNTKNGSIIVFHDSEKAFKKLEYALPKTLAHLSANGFTFRTL